MNKFLQSFIKVERSIQGITLVGVILLVGWFGTMSYRNSSVPSDSIPSPTVQP